MTRRRAAYAGGLALLLLAVAFLLTRRGAGAEPALAPPAPLPAARDAAPTPTLSTSGPAVTEVVEAPTPSGKAEQRSWGGGRAVAPRTPPAPATAITTEHADEQPLPTWVRLSIVAAALLAFFAVSLIATKQV